MAQRLSAFLSFVVLLALLAMPSFSAMTHKQAVAKAVTTTNTVVSQAITPNAANNLLHIFCTTNKTSAATMTPTATGYTFTGSNASSPYTQNTNSGGGDFQSWWILAINTSAVTFNCTTSGGGTATFLALIIDEFDGNSTSSPLDVHKEATGNSTAPSTGATATGLAGQNEAVIGACFSAGGITAVGSGYTKGGDDAQGDWSEYKILTTDTAAQTANFTATTGQWGCALSAYLPASGATTPAVRPHGFSLAQWFDDSVMNQAPGFRLGRGR